MSYNREINFATFPRTHRLTHCQLCLKLSTEGDMQAFRGSHQLPVEFHAHTSA